jgi:hypothetical protein
MSESFDPYYKWLAIPPAEQPPNFYRLLGIQLFETDLDVIDGAADARLMHLRSFQSGPRGPLSQQMMNEVSEARLTLLDPDKRAAYDGSLQQQLAEPSAQPGLPIEIKTGVAPAAKVNLSGIGVPAPPAATVEAAWAGPSIARKYKRKNNRLIPLLVITPPALLLLIVGSFIAFRLTSGEVADNTDANTNKTSINQQSDANSLKTLPEDHNKTNSDPKTDTSKENIASSEAKKTDDNQDNNTTTQANQSPAENDPTTSTDKSNTNENNTNNNNTDNSQNPVVSIAANPTPPIPDPFGLADRPLTMPEKMPDASTTQVIDAFKEAASREPLPIAPPLRIFTGDKELYETYSQETYQLRKDKKSRIDKLKEMAGNRLDELEKQYTAAQGKQKELALTKVARQRMAADSFVTFRFAKDATEDLRKLERTYQTEAAKIEDEFVRLEAKVTEKYLDGIDGIIRQLKKDRADKIDVDFLLAYRKLMEERTSGKPLAGQFIFITNPETKTQLFLNGKPIAFDKTGISEQVKLDLRQDLVSIAYYSDYYYSAAFLTFITKDKDLQIPILRSEVRSVGVLDPTLVDRQAIRESLAIAEEARAMSSTRRALTALNLPANDGEWFAAQRGQPTVFGIELKPEMLDSTLGTLTRTPGISLPDDQSMSVVKFDPSKKVLIIQDRNVSVGNEAELIEEACRRYGLAVEHSAGFDEDRQDYSSYHTIIACSNALMYFKDRDESSMSFLTQFMESGGHLLLFGTFNGSGAKESLSQFGFSVGFMHGSLFEPVGIASDLLFLGNESLIPDDRHLASTGNFSCSAEHTVLLKRGRGSNEGDPLMVTMNQGSGRLTYTQAEPGYRNSEWIITPIISWISRGSPTPPANTIGQLSED